jgi:hypothetical protein
VNLYRLSFEHMIRTKGQRISPFRGNSTGDEGLWMVPRGPSIMLILCWTGDDVHSSVIWSAFPGNDAGSHGIAIGEAAIYIKYF